MFFPTQPYERVVAFLFLLLANAFFCLLTSALTAFLKVAVESEGTVLSILYFFKMLLASVEALLYSQYVTLSEFCLYSLSKFSRFLVTQVNV